MKIFVISDTHGRNKEITEYLLKSEKPDLILHLGDYVEDGEKISELLGIETIMIRGNGDYFSQYEGDELIDINGIRIFLTHGHIYNVDYTLDNIIYKAKEVKADIVLFGHTHIPLNIKEDGVYIMNPGSPSFPRGGNFEKTFGVINIGDTMDIKIINIEEDIM